MSRKKLDLNNLEEAKGCFLVDVESIDGDVVFCYDVINGIVDTFSISWSYSPFYNIEDPDDLRIYEITDDLEDIKVFERRHQDYSLKDLHADWIKENGNIEMSELKTIFKDCMNLFKISP